MESQSDQSQVWVGTRAASTDNRLSMSDKALAPNYGSTESDRPKAFKYVTPHGQSLDYIQFRFVDNYTEARIFLCRLFFCANHSLSKHSFPLSELNVQADGSPSRHLWAFCYGSSRGIVHSTATSFEKLCLELGEKTITWTMVKARKFNLSQVVRVDDRHFVNEVVIITYL